METFLANYEANKFLQGPHGQLRICLDYLQPTGDLILRHVNRIFSHHATGVACRIFTNASRRETVDVACVCENGFMK